MLMVLALVAAMVTAVAATPAAPASATAGNPGVPSAPTTLYAEDFENGQTDGQTLLTDYTGAAPTHSTYTADAGWLTGCNGEIVEYNTPGAQLGNCTASGDALHIRQLAYALGALRGDPTPETNHAVGAYTENNPGADAIEFQTVDPIPLASASGRFVTFSVDASALNCGVSGPLYKFSLTSGNTTTAVGGQVNACTSAKTVTIPGGSVFPVGTYTSDGSVLVTGSSIGVTMRNANGSGVGNDAAFDNIRILDVTPQLDKSFSPATAATGGSSKLTFTVTNTDELAAKDGWSFTDDLPSGLKVAADPAAETTCPAGDVDAAAGATTVDVHGNLSAGMASCTITVNVTATQPGDYTNGPDNVTATGLNPPAPATVTFEKPAVTVVKHAGDPVDVNKDGITNAGDTIQYTFTVTNSGDVPLTDVGVTDDKAGDVTCAESTLAPGASETCSADDVYAITADDVTAGAVDNTATATGTSPHGTKVTSPPSETHTPAETADPGITVTKTASPSGPSAFTVGQKITYSFAATNTGNVPLSNIAVTDTDFTGTGDLSAIDCPTTTLAAGAAATCTATYTLTQADVDTGTVSNSATATGTPPAGDGTPPVSPPSTVVVPVPPAPAITVEKTADVKEITAAGQKITYSFLVTNTGNVTLNDVAVTDSDFTGSGTLSDITCPTTTLASEASETCTATYTTTQADVDGGKVSNSATATGTPPGDTPPPTSPPSTVTVPAPPKPAITVVKSASPSSAADFTPGQEVTYSFLVTNTGNVTLADPKVTDSDFTGSGTLSEISCPAEPDGLAPGAQETCTAEYTVTQKDVDAGKVSNTATATGVPPGEDTPPLVSPRSTVNIPEAPHPAMTVKKTADVTKITTAGQKVTYTFVATNTGNVSLTDPKITDKDFTGAGTLSAIDCPSVSDGLAPGATETCTATYTVLAADLTKGQLSNTATATGTPPAGPNTVSPPSTVKIAEVPPAVGGGDPALPRTGAQGVAAGAAGGIALLVLGAGALVLMRRRRA